MAAVVALSGLVLSGPVAGPVRAQSAGTGTETPATGSLPPGTPGTGDDGTDDGTNIDDAEAPMDRHLREKAPVVIIDDPRVAPELGAVPLESEDYDRAVARYLATDTRRNDAAQLFNRSVTELSDLLAARERLAAARNVAQRRRTKSDIRLIRIREDLSGVAVNGYVEGGLGGPLEGTFDVEEAMDLSTRRLYVNTVFADQLTEQRINVGVVNQMTAVLAETDAEQRVVEQRITEVTATRDRAATDRDQATEELALRKREVADARLLANVIDLDFTLVVFNAYFRGAQNVAVERPDCGLRWQGLAGIGRTESWHGTYSGGHVDADGNLTEHIYGIDLDGSNGTAVIPDSDDGALDLRADVDRAVGPMQFIPTTWRAFERDGSGDGRADPQNYYDTNVTAGMYLCHRRAGLETDEGMRAAFFSYNQSTEYVDIVLRRTHAYDRYVIPTVDGTTWSPPLPPPPPTSSTTPTTRVSPSTTASTSPGTPSTPAPTTPTTPVQTTPTTPVETTPTTPIETTPTEPEVP